MASQGFRRGGRRGRKRSGGVRQTLGNYGTASLVRALGGVKIEFKVLGRGGGEVTQSNAVRKFKIDTAERRVGTAAYRGLRKTASIVRLVARRSIKRGGRVKRYRQPRKLKKPRGPNRRDRYGKTDMPYPVFIAWLNARHAWRAGGSKGKPPRPPVKGGSGVGKPPKLGLGKLKAGILFQPGKGVTPAMAAKGNFGKAFFDVGAVMRPKGKQIIGRINRHRAPGLHEKGGYGEGTTKKRVLYPRRSYMQPAKDKAGTKRHVIKNQQDALRESNTKLKLKKR